MLLQMPCAWLHVPYTILWCLVVYVCAVCDLVGVV